MIGLSNNKLDHALMLEIVKEFRNHIAGGGTSNNLVSFIDDEAGDHAALAKTFISSMAMGTDQSESQKQYYKDTYLSSILDNTTGAYFMKDIISGEPFINVDAKTLTSNDSGAKLGDYLSIVYEKVESGLENANVKNDNDPHFLELDGVKSSDYASMVRVVTPQKSEYTSTALSSLVSLDAEYFQSSSVDTKGVEKKVAIKGHFAKPITSPETVYINGGEANKIPGDSSRKDSPGLGAFVIKTPEIGFGSRNDEQLNIFFNGITPLEMSRCTPYINLAVVTNEMDGMPKNLNNVTFMRFIKQGTGGGFVLDENIGLSTMEPYGFKDINTLFSNNIFEETVGKDISLMDIFTAPQTLANPDINNGPTDLGGTLYGSKILDPITPFLTLNNLSIDISGMGSALFSSKVGTMQLTLHDRSRLPDISHLVAANQFGSTKIVIEYGWSHPEGGIESENIVGKFLNSLRDRSVYTVKSSNFSFSDGNTVKISLNLACFGSDESRSISCASGAKIPLATFKTSITRIVEDILKRHASQAGSAGLPGFSGQVGDKAKSELREVRHLMRIGQRNTIGPNAMITYKQFSDLVSAYESANSNKDSADPTIFRNSLANMLGPEGKPLVGDGEVITSDALKDRIEAAKLEDTKDATSLIYGKLYALTDGYPAVNDSNGLYNTDPFKKAFCSFVDWEKELWQAGTVTLGKIMCSFVGHSLAMSGLFDEVQMFFYPFNELSGGARKHTTASLPIEKNLLKKIVAKKLAKSPRLSVNGFFNLIERKIIRDRGISAYGISAAIAEFEQTEDEVEKMMEDFKIWKASTEGVEAGEDVQKTKAAEIQDRISRAREIKKEGISAACRAIYEKDGGVPAEPKFVRPNISMYIESLTKLHTDKENKDLKEDSGQNPTKAGADYTKTICRVHIYDEQTSKRPQEALINSLLSEGSAGKVIVKGIGGSDEVLNAYLKAEEGTLETGSKFQQALMTYVKKADAYVLKEAVKRGYPSITYGASTGVIKSVSVSSNVSNNISQTIMISSYANRNNPQDVGSSSDQFDEVTIVPATITVEMLGNVLIQRGNQIYIDFGTATTLDNLYSVKSVKHNISAGNFTTSVDLIFAGQGDITSLRGKIEDAITLLG